MIKTLSFAIHVTYTCPLSCSHCCFESSPQNPHRLSKEQIFATIDALDVNVYRMIAFTGGEPILLGKTLEEAIARSSNKGLNTRLVTSAYFGKNYNRALKIIENLKTAGLDEISISWDDYHEEFVEFSAIKNVFSISQELGISVAINCVQDNDSGWSSERIRLELGIADDDRSIVVDSPINKTGRAETALNTAEIREESLIGPCPYVVTGPTLSAKNKLLACCGVIQETNHLVINHDFKPEFLESDIEKAKSSPLLAWLFLRGPYAIMKEISKTYNVEVPSESEVGGNCEACRVLFHNKKISEHIPSILEKKSYQVFSEISVLESLGMLTPEQILKLWTRTQGSIDNAIT